jgi:hypothetical protein
VTVSAQTAETIETDVPGRLDRLPWARSHWLVVFALARRALRRALAEGRIERRSGRYVAAA